MYGIVTVRGKDARQNCRYPEELLYTYADGQLDISSTIHPLPSCAYLDILDLYLVQVHPPTWTSTPPKVSPPGRTVRLSPDPRRSPINPSNSQAVLLCYFSRFSFPPAICTRVPRPLLRSQVSPSRVLMFHSICTMPCPRPLPFHPNPGLA